MTVSLRNVFVHAFVLVLTLIILGSYTSASAAGVVSLTFDDGNPSQYEIPAKILKAGGQNATFYINSGFLDGGGWFMSWAQALDLHRQGFEIAGHTLHHIELPTVNQSTKNTQVNNDYLNFVRRGVVPTNFASPYGAYDNPTIATIAKRYNSHRAFANQGLNYWPYNKYILYVRYVTNQTSLEQVKGWVDEAVAEDAWLILVFHEVLDVVDPTDQYSWETSKFKAFVAHLNAKGIKAKTVKEALKQPPNLVQNSSFESGLTNWTTDRPLNATVNMGNNGSYPSSRNSLRMLGSANAAHVFGQKIPVSFGTIYGFRAYTNSSGLNAGEVGFYMDEYDTAGNWISGKWLGGFTNQNVVDKAYVYTPTSADVATTAIQIYMTAGSSGTVYIDNVELFTR